MKKFLCLFLCVVMCTALFTVKTFASGNEVKVMINGQYISFDVPPQVINGRTMIPIRAIFESLGATVQWDDSTNTAYATNGYTNVSLRLNERVITVNGNQIAMDTAATMINNRILAPARYVAESFGCGVAWEESTQIVHILTPRTIYDSKYPYINAPAFESVSHILPSRIEVNFDIDKEADLIAYIYNVDNSNSGDDVLDIVSRYIDELSSNGWHAYKDPEEKTIGGIQMLTIDFYSVNSKNGQLKLCVSGSGDIIEVICVIWD